MRTKNYLILFIAVCYIVGQFTVDNWKTRLYHGDSNGYYLHVVSLFVNQDVGDYDKTITTLLETSPTSFDARKDKYGIRLTEKGRRYIKYTVGVPVMETPFFLIAHAYAKLSGKYPADGWSLPYTFCVNLAIIFYVLAGLYLLISVLERYFPDKVVILTVLSLALATNLFFQATYVTMSHGFLFFDFCLLIFLTSRFYDKPNIKKAAMLGAVVGLIAITRVPEVVGALVPVLWGIHNVETFKKRFDFFLKNYQYLLVAALGFFAVFSLQIAYWYYVSGQFIFNPYQGEGFNFLKPDILNGWFNYKNGWLVYTPIMAFSLIGWWLLRKHAPELQLAILSFVGLNAWIHYSYYVWNYYPGLGSRPMVECYPLLSFGLAAFYLFCFNRKWLRGVPIILLVFFTWLNLFQTWQMRKGMIWSERSSMAFYWTTFGTMTSTIESLRAYDSREFQPDTSDLQFIKRLAFESFEDSTKFSVVQDVHFSGDFSLFPESEYTALLEEKKLSDYAIEPKDWIYVGIKGYKKAERNKLIRDYLGDLVVHIKDGNGQTQKWRAIKSSSHIGNDNYSIWPTGADDIWGEGGFFVKIPARSQSDWTMKVYFRNSHFEKVYLDDFKVEHYR